ncbi:short-chain dehydrogenase [Pseudomonas nitroreducens]|uniref:Short-chain dehydrogenase n=1 Tax=Pseudomonas nitroreducens TaxID=46680 RepID=A0A5R9A452_PSENT|nr:NnrS family protein [Pseudomonas nitroreducens]TLP73320.1 short-chain dehydrogenase [Pseudomonas nitroreducens]
MLLVDRKALLTIPPLWRLGFRPFFLGGAVFALIAIAAWAAVLLGVLPTWQPLGGWLAWHRHEMLFGFAAAIIAGFLLTAVQTWTGRPGVSGKPLMVLSLVWLAARVGWLVGAPLWLVTLLELAFMPALAFFIGRSLWQVRQKRNYPIIAVLSLLTLADALVMAGVWTGNDAWQRGGALGALWLVAALMGLIGGRVIPFFTQRGLGRTAQVPAWNWLDNSLLGGTMLVAVLSAVGIGLTPHPLVGLLFAALAVGHLIRLWRWYDRDYWGVPLLWSLHLAYLWMMLAPAGMALWNFLPTFNVSLAIHALTVGGVGGLILAMVARVSLGHTGRPLQPPKVMSWAFALLNLGVVARVLLVMWWPLEGLSIAAACWVVAFLMFAWHYGPMFWKPRLDGQPG